MLICFNVMQAGMQADQGSKREQLIGVELPGLECNGYHWNSTVDKPVALYMHVADQSSNLLHHKFVQNLQVDVDF